MNYDFRCKECNTTKEINCYYEDLKTPDCDKCNKPMTRVYCTNIKPGCLDRHNVAN